ncbi:MAG: sigma-54-dependent transcriptional regulator [Acidobacteriota bacterium]
MARKILIVDDEEEIRVSCVKILQSTGYEPVTAPDGEQALELLPRHKPELMLLDLRLPGRGGLEVLRAAQATSPETYVIIFTAFAEISTAVEAIKGGAFNYLSKPFTDDQLLLAIEQALEHRELRMENLTPAGPLAEGFDEILGDCAAMQRIFDLVRKVADSDASVLITGESGTGKELIARTLHTHSSRKSGPFVPVDCAALPENLLESELFGHEKGAFTGAQKLKRGLLEMGQGGTVFLDEVGDLPLSLQPKLLRTLQERELRRIGGEKLIPIDIRLVSATSQELVEKSREGTFREELYYRLNVVNVLLPPLRDRDRDVVLLAHHFLGQFNQQYRKPVNAFSPEVVKRFLHHSWPGNVRELQNVVERAVLVAYGSSIQLHDLPESLQTPQAPDALSWKSVRRQASLSVERPYLIDLLKRHQGNVSTVAKEAGVPRKVIYRLADRFGIEIAAFRPK